LLTPFTARANAKGKGTEGESGKFLLQVGMLISKINKIQKDKYGMRNEIIFLSENVVFSDKQMIDIINKCYGDLPAAQIDAEYFGPCARDRFYWLNVSACFPVDAACIFPFMNPVSYASFSFL